MTLLGPIFDELINKGLNHTYLMNTTVMRTFNKSTNIRPIRQQVILKDS
jgi:hypothetical protein